MWEDMRNRQMQLFNMVMDDFLLLIKRVQFIWKYCFTTGANKGPTGVNAPVLSSYVVKKCSDSVVVFIISFANNVQIIAC
jgi:hypothetical protein